MRAPSQLRLTCTIAKEIINRRALDTAQVVLTFHAQERMEERGIVSDEVYRILRSGAVFELPIRNEQGDWQVEIEKRMPGGRDVAVVTVVPQDDGLIVRTVMWRDL